MDVEKLLIINLGYSYLGKNAVYPAYIVDIIFYNFIINKIDVVDYRVTSQFM